MDFPWITDSQSTSAFALHEISSPLTLITASLGETHCLLSQSTFQLWSFYLQKHRNHSVDLQIVSSKKQSLDLLVWKKLEPVFVPKVCKVGHVCEERLLALSPLGYMCKHQAKCKFQWFFFSKKHWKWLHLNHNTGNLVSSLRRSPCLSGLITLHMHSELGFHNEEFWTVSHIFPADDICYSPLGTDLKWFYFISPHIRQHVSLAHFNGVVHNVSFT